MDPKAAPPPPSVRRSPRTRPQTDKAPEPKPGRTAGKTSGTGQVQPGSQLLQGQSQAAGAASLPGADSALHTDSQMDGVTAPTTVVDAAIPQLDWDVMAVRLYKMPCHCSE